MEEFSQRVTDITSHVQSSDINHLEFDNYRYNFIFSKAGTWDIRNTAKHQLICVVQGPTYLCLNSYCYVIIIITLEMLSV